MIKSPCINIKPEDHFNKHFAQVNQKWFYKLYGLVYLSKRVVLMPGWKGILKSAFTPIVRKGADTFGCEYYAKTILLFCLTQNMIYFYFFGLYRSVAQTQTRSKDLQVL